MGRNLYELFRSRFPADRQRPVLFDERDRRLTYAEAESSLFRMKTEGDLQEWAYTAARRVLVLVVGATAVVSLWTPFLNPAIAERWFSWPNIALLSPVPLVTAALAIGLWTAIRKRRQALPFLISMGLFLLAYAGLAISLWPNVVPPEVTLWEAASPPATQIFLLYGVAILIPVTLAYTAYSYYVFRGKVRPGEGYHHS